MNGILWPIKAGADNRSSIEAALGLAESAGLKVYFLYIIDPALYGDSTGSAREETRHKLQRQGKETLRIIRTLAANRGVVANGVICEGSLESQMLKATRKLDRHYVILGYPLESSSLNKFSPSKKQEFNIQGGFETTAAAAEVPDSSSVSIAVESLEDRQGL